MDNLVCGNSVLQLAISYVIFKFDVEAFKLICEAFRNGGISQLQSSLLYENKHKFERLRLKCITDRLGERRLIYDEVPLCLRNAYLGASSDLVVGWKPLLFYL